MSPRLPPTATLARWAVTLGPVAARAAQQLYETGRFRQLAVLHARTLVDGTFSDEFVDGERVWVAWAGDEPVAAYPEVDEADLAALVGRSRPDRRRDPDELPTRRVRDRLQGAGDRVRGTSAQLRRRIGGTAVDGGPGPAEEHVEVLEVRRDDAPRAAGDEDAARSD